MMAWLLLFAGRRSGRYWVIGLSSLVAGSVLFYKCTFSWQTCSSDLGPFAPWFPDFVLVTCRWFSSQLFPSWRRPRSGQSSISSAAPMDGSGLSQYVKTGSFFLSKTLRSRHHYRSRPIRSDKTCPKARCTCFWFGSGSWARLSASARPMTGQGAGGDHDGTGNLDCCRVRLASPFFLFFSSPTISLWPSAGCSDANSLTASDELLHRRLAWAYFGVSAW